MEKDREGKNSIVFGYDAISTGGHSVAIGSQARANHGIPRKDLADWFETMAAERKEPGEGEETRSTEDVDLD